MSDGDPLAKLLDELWSVVQFPHGSVGGLRDDVKHVLRKYGACECNIGVQQCPVHPGRLLDQEQKIAFRKAWDARVDRGAK